MKKHKLLRTTEAYDRAICALYDVYFKKNQLKQLYREEETFRRTHPTYPENHVFDKDKGEAWNKEEVKRRNHEREEALKKYSNLQNFDAYIEECDKVIREYIQQEFNFPQPIAEKVYLKARKKEKYNGGYDILDAAREIGKEVRELLDLYEQSKS